MNCESCQNALLDLAYGELNESVAAEVRGHLEQCGGCRDSYQRLTEAIAMADRLPQSEPSSGVEQRVMQAAHEKAAEQAAAPGAEPPYAAIWRGWIAFVGRFAMSRQVAVAAIMLVVVAVGLWYVPQIRQHPEAAGSVINHPDLAGGGPSDRLKPAEPLDLAIDSRSGRIRPKGAEPPGWRRWWGLEQAAKPAEQHANPQPSQIEGNEQTEAAEAPAAPEQTAEERAAATGEATQVENAPAAATPTEAPRAEGAAGPSDLLEKRAAEPGIPAPAPAAEPARKGAAPLEPAVRERSAEDLDSLLSNALATGAGKGESAEPAKRAKKARRPEMRMAAAAASQTGAGEPTPDALLKQARAYRDSGRCALAVQQYETIISKFPASSAAGSAMVEAADCYRLLGNTARARTLMQRAAALPSLNPEAARALKALEPK